MSFDWRGYGALALDAWNRLSMWEQSLLSGGFFCIAAFAALYWTPLGKRGLAVKCLVLALMLHAMAVGMLEMRRSAAAERADHREVRIPIQMTRATPDLRKILAPPLSAVRPQSKESIVQRQAEPEAPKRPQDTPRTDETPTLASLPDQPIPAPSNRLATKPSSASRPEAAAAPDAPQLAPQPTAPSMQRLIEPQFQPTRIAPIVARRSIDSKPAPTAAPSLSTPRAESLDIPSPTGSAATSGGQMARAAIARPAAIAPVAPPAASAEREQPPSKTSISQPSESTIVARDTSADERPVRKSINGNAGAESEKQSSLLASRTNDDLLGSKPSNRPFVLSNSRTAANRIDVVLQHGGSKATEQAVADALSWLAAHQSPEGNWDSDQFFDRCPPGEKCSGPAVEINSDTGLTGLSLLAFLGAGQTHTGGGQHAEVVRRALSWLIRMQRADGDLREDGRIYCHSMATLALCEAFSMTRDERLKEPAQKAVDYLARAQHSETGSWRYAPGEFGDTSVFGWAVLALHSAKNASFKVPPQVWTRAEQWLPLVRSGPNGGLAAYRPGYDPSHAMTAEAMVCKQIFGTPRDASFEEAGDYLLARLPGVDDYHLYYWYYGTLGMFQLGGVHWQRWNDRLTATLLGTQEKSGHAKGSWTPQKPFGVDGGRVFATAASALCLEVYYRYLPMYQSSGRAAGPEKSP